MNIKWQYIVDEYNYQDIGIKFEECIAWPNNAISEVCNWQEKWHVFDTLGSDNFLLLKDKIDNNHIYGVSLWLHIQWKIDESELTMTVNGEVYISTLKTIATIPISMDLDLVPWRNVSVTKIRIAMKIASIIKAIMILRCYQNNRKVKSKSINWLYYLRRQIQVGS